MHDIDNASDKLNYAGSRSRCQHRKKPGGAFAGNTRSIHNTIVSYPCYGALQELVACNTVMLKSKECTDAKQSEIENRDKQDSKCIESRWCLSSITHTQKIRSQRIKKPTQSR
jgi:hypothetical protein